jgi:hypothetical protein
MNPHPVVCDILISRDGSNEPDGLFNIKFEVLPRVGESVHLPGEGNEVFTVEHVLHMARGADRANGVSPIILSVVPSEP